MTALPRSFRNALLAVVAACSLAANAQGLQPVREINRTLTALGAPGSAAALGTGWVTSLCFQSQCHPWFTDGTAEGTRLIKAIGLFTRDYTSVGSLVYFLDQNHQLWRTDGTSDGTNPVAFAPPFVLQLRAIGGLLFFRTLDESLWRTDGTAAGTMPLATSTRNLVASGSWLYFSRSTGFSTAELWRTDGSVGGTQLVRAIPSGILHPMVAAGGNLVFRTSTTDSSDIWGSDGTSGGTTVLLHVASGLPVPMVSMAGSTYLLEPGPGPTTRLWRSDGTAGGTVPLYTWSYATQTPELVATSTRVYFSVADPSAGMELWSSDGSVTAMVKDINPVGSSSPWEMMAAGDRLFFTAFDGGRLGLWKSDGTEGSTVEVMASNALRPYVATGSVLLTGGPVWLSDGTPAGTRPLLTSPGQPSNSSSCGTAQAIRDGSLYFLADDGIHGCQLWRSDGTEAGTLLVKEIAGARFASSGSMVAMGGYVYYAMDDGVHGHELWRSDGTAAGTHLVADIRAGSWADPTGFVANGSTLYFSATQNGVDRDLWKSDGTPAGTVRVKGFANWSGPEQLTVAGGYVYFVLDAGGSKLYRSDGTDAGTIALANLLTGNGPLLAGQDRIFTRDDGGILVSNGTPEGTRFVTTLGGLMPLGVLGNSVVIQESSSSVQSTLWTTDGSDAPWIQLGSFDTSFTAGKVLDGILYFADSNAARIFATDGTPNRVRSVQLGGTSNNFLLGGRNTMFVTSSENNSFQLWRTAGTQAGTALVEDVGPGNAINGLLRAAALPTGLFLWKEAGSGGMEPAFYPFDTTPDPMTFQSRSNVLANSWVFSDGAQVHATNEASAVTAANGEFCVASGPDCSCDLAPFSSSGAANDGQYICVRHRAAGSPGAVTETSLSVGGVGASFLSTIGSSNPATLGFEATEYSVDEDGTVALIVQRSGDAAEALSVQWGTTAGSATSGANVQAASGTLSWAAGDLTSRSIVVGGPSADVSLADDSSYDPGETFAVTLHSASPGAMIAGGSATVAIVDNDSLFSLEISNGSVAESGFNRTLLVRRIGGVNRAASVAWTTVGGSATAGSDYGILSSPSELGGVLAFSPGESVKAMTVGPQAATGVHVPVLGDDILENDETFSIALAAAGHGELGSPASATITIEGTTAFAMESATKEVSEGAGSVVINIQRLGSAAAPAAISYTTSNGSALSGTHYTAQTGSVFWSASDGASKAVSIPLLNDAVANGTRTFAVTLRFPSGGALATPSSTTVGIIDDDNTVQLSAATAVVAEAGPALALAVTRAGIAGGPVSVNWTAAGGTASAGVDYGPPVSGTLSWAANDVTSRQIVIPVVDDNSAEPPETFSVTLEAPVNAKLGTLTVAQVTLNDNDSGVAFSEPSYNVAEAMGSISLQVRRAGPVSAAASVKWSTANGSAVAGQDFGTRGSTAQLSGTLAWLAGDGSPKTIVIPIVQDMLSEGSESFTVRLSGPSRVLLGSPDVATVSIGDDEPPIESRFSFTEVKVLAMENSGTAVLTVRRQAAGAEFTFPATVAYATVAGTAIATSDYLARSGSLTWAATDVSEKTISVPIVNSAVAESHESFKVTLITSSPRASIATPDATITIIDDDDPFPRFGAVPDGWTVPSGATAGWHASNDAGAYEGVFTLRSDAIDDGEMAQVEVTRAFAAGTVTFRVKVSSEAGFDKLRFFVDDVEKGAWSGVSVPGWQAFSTPVTAGTHTLRWSYEKDDSASVGQDAAWIDALSFP